MILDSLLHVISWTMIHFLWQGALIVVAAYLLTCIVNLYSTSARYTIAETVFFFHPVVWWLSGTLREEREHICDRIASRACGDFARYAGALTALEESRSVMSPLVIAANGSRPGSLLRRLERLLGTSEAKRASGWFAPLTAPLICCITVGLFALTAAAQSQPEPEPSKQTSDQVDLIRDIIDRFDSDYVRNVDVPQLLKKQHVALSPDGPWLALARGNTLFLIERDTGNSQSHGVFGGIKSIAWKGESVDVTRADGTNSTLNVPLPVVKLRHYSGHPMSANALVKALVGFADTAPKWMAWGNKENTISLVGLEPGKHWLVPQPHRAVVQVEMPQGKWRRIPNYSVARSQLYSNKVFAKSSVQREDDKDIIVVTIHNNSGATFLLSEQNLDLDTEVNGHQYRVLSPQWTSDDALKFPITTIEQGEEQVIRLFWNDWVERGLWVTGGVQFGLGPWPETQNNGKVWVRVNGPGFGTLPVSLPQPESRIADPDTVSKRAESDNGTQPPPTARNTLAALDYDLRAALQADPTLSANGDTHHPQDKAIAAWRHFLKRDDLDQEQQIFAWWRIGSLTAYNFSPDKGERSDPETAAQALSNVRELAGGRISRETLNAATVYGGIEGPPDVRADRMATAYRWLFKRTDAMVKESVSRINHDGYGIAGEFMLGGMRLDTNAKKQQFLTSQLAEHRKIITRRITEEIRWSQSPDSIRKLLQSIKSVANQSQLAVWQELAKEVTDAEQSTRAPAATKIVQPPTIDEDQLTTRRLFDQYINRVGKFPTDEVRAAIELVAARGRSDHAFRELVMSKFAKRGQAKQPDVVSRKLLAVITKWLTIEGGYRWNHERSPENPQQHGPMPNQAELIYLASPLLERVIARGYQADRKDVPAYVFAARQAHHPQARAFLLDALNEPKSNVSPFETEMPEKTKSKWRDFPVGDTTRFLAAVGLAELGDASGVEWLIANATPNDFGNGNLNHVQHPKTSSYSLRENCRYVLAELSQLPSDTDTIRWRDWWQRNKDSFVPISIPLKTQILGGN